MSSTKRDHLIDTALELFSRDGFHATGIDKILSASGVAKMTLYNHFKSKDELILAVLRQRDETFRNWFMRTVENSAEEPRDRLLAIFDALEQWIRQEGFCGCTFINAAAEFGERGDAILGSCAEHKRLMLDYVEKLAAAAGARDPEELAFALNLLAEGAIVTAQVMGQKDSAARAKRPAKILIQEAMEPVTVQ
ncbi:MAG: TetR/AcrR family transcriptional regulator [Proteobacteria bacterium]|nr:TetR/AcrR family transcriptional regulator [Pseudomonadota bacterium]